MKELIGYIKETLHHQVIKVGRGNYKRLGVEPAINVFV